MNSNSQRKGNPLKIGMLVLLGINAVIFGIAFTNLNTEIPETCACSPPDYDRSEIEIENQAIAVFTNANDTDHISYFQVNLVFNSSKFLNKRYFIAFDSPIPEEGFGISVESKNRDDHLNVHESKFSQEVSLNENNNRSMSIAWIEWMERDDDDNYLEPMECVRIHFLLGEEEKIEWGDTLTLRFYSSQEELSTLVGMGVILPQESVENGTQIQGDYGQIFTNLY